MSPRPSRTATRSASPTSSITQFDIPTRTHPPQPDRDRGGTCGSLSAMGKDRRLDPKTGGSRNPDSGKVRARTESLPTGRFICGARARQSSGAPGSGTGEMRRSRCRRALEPPTLFPRARADLDDADPSAIASPVSSKTESFKEYAIPTKSRRPYGIVSIPATSLVLRIHRDKIGRLTRRRARSGNMRRRRYIGARRWRST